MKNRPPPSKSDRRGKGGPSNPTHSGGRDGAPGRTGGKPGPRGKAPSRSAQGDEPVRAGGRPVRGPRPQRPAGEEQRPSRGPRPGGPGRSDTRPARTGPRHDQDDTRPARTGPRRDHDDTRPARSGPRRDHDNGRDQVRSSRPMSAAEELGLETAPLRASTGPVLNKHNLLYGIHAVSAAWVNPTRKIRDLFVTEAGLEALDSAFDKASQAELDRPEPQLVEKEDLDKLLPPGAVHQGVALSCAPLPEVQIEDICIASANDPQALVIVLDQVTDPHNVGAVLRSAAAFGAKAVIVQDRHAPPVTGTLAKTASGAVEAVPLVRVTNLARAIDDLKAAGFWSVGLAESGQRHLHEVDLTGRSALVLGSEGDGIRRLTGERCDEIVRLPTGGPVGSLNVSNAAAVALYEVARRR